MIRITLVSAGDKRDSVEVTRYNEDNYLFYCIEGDREDPQETMVVLDRDAMLDLYAWLDKELDK